MKNALPLILSLVMVFMFTGCFETPQVTIEGYAKINNNTEHRYKAVVEVDDQASIEAYKWEIVTGEGEYRLLNANSSEATFSAIDAGNYTLKVTVTVNGKRSMAELMITVIETEIINGYTLPPEPDPEINNSTLLGIDSNKNGVRDDVERWIYIKYQNDAEYPKTKTAIAMQFARGYQHIIGNNPKYAYENKTYKKADYAMDCFGYLIDQGIKQKNLRGVDITKFILKHKIFNEEIESKLFNTKERTRAYFNYNSSLSGHILGGGGGVLSSTKGKCDFNIDALGELQ